MNKIPSQRLPFWVVSSGSCIPANHLLLIPPIGTYINAVNIAKLQYHLPEKSRMNYSVSLHGGDVTLIYELEWLLKQKNIPISSIDMLDLYLSFKKDYKEDHDAYKKTHDPQDRIKYLAHYLWRLCNVIDEKSFWKKTNQALTVLTKQRAINPLQKYIREKASTWIRYPLRCEKLVKTAVRYNITKFAIEMDEDIQTLDEYILQREQLQRQYKSYNVQFYLELDVAHMERARYLKRNEGKRIPTVIKQLEIIFREIPEYVANISLNQYVIKEEKDEAYVTHESLLNPGAVDLFACASLYGKAAYRGKLQIPATFLIESNLLETKNDLMTERGKQFFHKLETAFITA